MSRKRCRRQTLHGLRVNQTSKACTNLFLFCSIAKFASCSFSVEEWKMSSRYVCVECEEKAELLYSNFPGSNNIRIEHCPSCGQPVDSYVEYDVSLILLDMMLLVRPVWRHVLFNHDTARLHWKLAVVCLFCDGYMKWVTASREDEALRALNSTDIVFQAAMQIQLYVFTFVSALELAAFLLLTVALYWFVRPLIRKSASNVDAIVRCLLLASTGKVLYIPAIIWLQAGSAIYLQLILVYVVLCGALALSLTVKCSYMQALMVIILAFFWSALIMKPVGEWLYQLDLHLLTVWGSFSFT